MSDAVVLWHLDPERFDRAAKALAGLHPVEEAPLRAVFGRLEGDFFAFWTGGAERENTRLLAQEKPAARAVLRQALTALSARRSWTFPSGIASAIHAVVGADPRGLQGLYRLSGGPPSRRMPGTAWAADVAVLVDPPAAGALDVLLPERFAIEAGERGLLGAWSGETLDELAPLVDRAATRERIDAMLLAREQSLWGRLSGDAARCATLRGELDPGTWAEWQRIVEAVRTAHEGSGYLGYEPA